MSEAPRFTTSQDRIAFAFALLACLFALYKLLRRP